MSGDLWSRVLMSEPDLCWPWMGPRNKKGYGAHGKKLAHREVHHEETGHYPEAVLHTCDNPPCCNPMHLEDGTNDSNNKDAIVKQRHAHGERSPHCVLTTEQVELLRVLEGAVTTREAGHIFGISHQHVSRIWRRKNRALS